MFMRELAIHFFQRIRQFFLSGLVLLYTVVCVHNDINKAVILFEKGGNLIHNYYYFFIVGGFAYCARVECESVVEGESMIAKLIVSLIIKQSSINAIIG
ncbi:MAG: hypothetical protein CSB47_00085 [Proteobacteria bacterium]|nr:MAG: hypothetical protein CSB47_00085 [Pseudomonadota bacterium]